MERYVGKNYPDDELPYRDRPFNEVAEILLDNLGRVTLAFALEVDIVDINQLEQYEGTDKETIMRDLAEAIEKLAQKYVTDEMVETVMFGQSTAFDGRAPIAVVREGGTEGSARVAAADLGPQI